MTYHYSKREIGNQIFVCSVLDKIFMKPIMRLIFRILRSK